MSLQRQSSSERKQWLMLLVSMWLKKLTRSKRKRALMSHVGNIKLPGNRGFAGGLWDYVGKSFHFTGFLAGGREVS